MLVCHCKGMTERALRRTVKNGACSVAAVTRSCGAGGACGGCRPAIEQIVAEVSASRASILSLERFELSPAR